VLEEALENEPAAHGTHVSGVLAAVAVEYVPRLHAEHAAVASVLADHVPGGHGAAVGLGVVSVVPVTGHASVSEPDARV
jgi:hypothetical protein